MNQEKIWAYYQNEGVESFEAALPRYNFIVNNLKLHLKPPANILNIGVGSGKLEILLMSAGYNVSSLDPDPNAINKLTNQGINAHVGVIEQLPFENSFFEAVIASEVLEHLEETSLNQAISQIRRILKANGYFIGTVPYQEHLIDNLTVCPNCGEAFHRWGHRQSFDKQKLLTLFEDGFKLKCLSRRSFVSWGFSPKKLIKSCFKWILGRLGEQIASPHFYFEFVKDFK